MSCICISRLKHPVCFLYLERSAKCIDGRSLDALIHLLYCHDLPVGAVHTVCAQCVAVSVCRFSAGCIALPSLINIKAVIEQRQCTGVWNQKDELPVRMITFALFTGYSAFLF